MAYFAFVNAQNEVVEVIAGRDEDDLPEGISDWETYYSTKRPGLVCLRTSRNTHGGVHIDPDTREPSADQSKAFRFNFACKGYTYNPELDAFIAPQPFPSWTLSEQCLWEPPVPLPADSMEDYSEGGILYGWDEETTSWVLAEIVSL